jgi:hypothetical protein
LNDVGRREVIENVESLLDQYCMGCFLNKSFKQEGGKRFAHRFCITQCTVGEKLKEFGKKLS